MLTHTHLSLYKHFDPVWKSLSRARERFCSPRASSARKNWLPEVWPVFLAPHEIFAENYKRLATYFGLFLNWNLAFWPTFEMAFDTKIWQHLKSWTVAHSYVQGFMLRGLICISVQALSQIIRLMEMAVEVCHLFFMVVACEAEFSASRKK